MTTAMSARMIRFEVPVDDQWHRIDLPPYSPLRHIHSRRPDAVEFWVEQLLPADGSPAVTDARELRVFGTGQPYDLHEVDYKGTALAADGALVWHLFERIRVAA